MFSSINFSSLLPAGLGLAPGTTPTQEKPPVVDRVEDNETDPEDNVEKLAASKDPKSTKKKEKPATETFVFVRPPPAKNNHPLNLQVQLVPPRNPNAPTSASNSAAGTPRESVETDREGPSAEGGENTEGAPLSRTPSSVSAYSQFSAPTTQAPSASTASFSSYNSTASSTSSRRVIIPLYNLQAHNVMTNTIVDAGTDAKIARFTKKGLEMVELGMLECTEVWASKDAAVAAAPVTSPSASSFMSAKRLPPPSDHSEPASSNTSLSSSGVHPSDQPTPTTSKRQAFRNLFSNKVSAGSPTPLATPNGHLQTTPRQSDTSAFSSPQRHSKRLSTTSLNFAFKRDRSSSPNPSMITGQSNLSSRGGSPRASIDDASPNTPTPQQNSFAQASSGLVPPSIIVPADGGPQSVGYVTSRDQILLPATLGIQPTLNSLLPFPIPFALVNNERGSDRAKVQLPTDLPYKIPRGPAMYVWIVRRWLKQSFMETPPNLLGINLRGFNTGENARGAGKGMTEVEVRFEWTKRSKPKKSKKAKKSVDNASTAGSQRRQPSKRMSIASAISVSSEGGAPGDAENDTGYDSGEESEPEDSETPWNCVVKVRRVNPGPEGGSVVKLKLGSLSPTPHHPKVVGMLKVPYPMPDIRFLPADQGGVVLEKRKGLVADDSKGLVLSAEEMKDILCSTGIWLVIREGFGGVGRVGRKGDGWRIRA